MTERRRADLFSQESLSVKEIQELYGFSYSSASKLVGKIKAKSDRLGIRGRVHIKDYELYFGSSPENKQPEKEKELFKFGHYYGGGVSV